MRDYLVISVPADLLPQVLRDLLDLAADPNLVEVTDAEMGKVIHAHPQLAEAWYQKINAPAKQVSAPKAAAAEVPKPVVPTPESPAPKVLATDVPAKKATSASDGEEPK